MEKVFLDSDYLIDYLRGKTHSKALMERIRQKQIEAYISVVTLFELYTGALLSANPNKRIEDIEALLGWFEVVEITKEIMFIAAKIYVGLRKKGLMIEIQDVLIAASSLSKNIGLATKNKKHFQNIKELHLL